MREIDQEDARSQFLDFMKCLDVQAYNESEIVLDGELHRYRTHEDSPGKLSGAYCVYPEGLPAGFVQDWRKGIKETWHYDTSVFDDVRRAYYESEEFKREAAEQRRQAEAKRKEQRERAAQAARAEWELLAEVPSDHEYLKSKGISAHGLRYNVETQALAVPLRDKTGEVRSIQWIYPNGEKRFYKDAGLDGVYYSIGLSNDAPVILLGEGMATMTKVHELTEYPVVAAISCHRLLEVAKILHTEYPNSQLVITADDDQQTGHKLGRNPGKQEAAKVRDAGLAAGVITPPFKNGDSGTDWDNYAQEYGGSQAYIYLKSGITDALNAYRRERYAKEAEELGELRSEMFSQFVLPKPGVNCLIDGWIPAEGTVMLFAPSASGKSFVMLDMAFSIACEEISEWQGQKVLKHGTVVYFAGEGQRGMRKRCAGLAAARGIAPEHVKMYIVSDVFSLDDEDPRAGIKRAIANIGKLASDVVLVIFDTTNCFMSGDESKTSDATRYLRSCQMIGKEFGCTVNIVNHTGLSMNSQDRSRGSTAFRDEMDVEIKCSRDKAVIKLEMTKAKDMEQAAPKKFRLKQVEVAGYIDANGSLETTCILEDAFDIQEDTLPSDTQPKGKKMSDAEEFARRTYLEAAKRYGEIQQDVDGRDYVRVQTEDWRKVCFELSSADNDGAKRVKFYRVKERLYEKLQILFKEELCGTEYYSLKPAGDAYELEILTHLRNQKQAEE